MTIPAAFPAVRYRFDFIVETPIRLPEYAGSTLRGAFGGSLRRIACVTRETQCKTCALYRACAYPAVFETPPPEGHLLQKFSQIPNPFVVEPPDWGECIYGSDDRLSFDFILIGRAIRHLPLVVMAWQRAFERGVGKGDGTARLNRVSIARSGNEQIVFTHEAGVLQTHDTRLPAALPLAADTLKLDFHTPLRLQHNGRPIGPDELTPRDLLMGLVRRTALITEFHLGQRLDLDFHALGEAARGITGEKQLRWRDWTRYSSRQKQEMALGGVVGTWLLRGDLGPFAPFLHLGQWLHAGKNATFGLGRYTIE